MEAENKKENGLIKKASGFIKRVHALFAKFLYTDGYIAFVAVMVFLSWITNSLIAELIVFFVIITYTLYTQKTMLPLVPMLIMMAFMLPNSFKLSDMTSYWYFAIIGALPVSGFFWFFIKNKIKFKKSRFLIPSLVFCGALLCSGLSSPYYLKSVNFMMIACLVALYLFIVLVLFNGIDKLEFHYVAKCLFAAGLVVLTQILTAYLKAGSISEALASKNTLDVVHIGWGKNNTMAAVLAMCVPAAFYLASKAKYNYVFLAAATAFIVGILFTKSRGGALFTFLLLPFSIVFMFRQTPRERRKRAAVSMAVSLLLVTAMLLIFWDDIGEVVLYLIEKGFSDSGRLDMYKQAWDTFLKRPVFGVGWDNGVAGQPPYAWFYAVHCTLLQYLVSGGIPLFAAAVWLFGKRYLTFYSDYKPHHVFFLMALLSHDLYGLIDNMATLPYCVMIAGIIFLALEKEIRSEAEAAKKLLYKQEKFYF